MGRGGESRDNRGLSSCFYPVVLILSPCQSFLRLPLFADPVVPFVASSTVPSVAPKPILGQPRTVKRRRNGNEPLSARARHSSRSHGQGGVCDRSHCNDSRRPRSAAAAHACSSQGHGGRCDRSQCNTLTFPYLAAFVNTNAFHGQGGVCNRSHCSTSKLPYPAAASHAVSSHGQGGRYDRNHCKESRRSFSAAI